MDFTFIQNEVYIILFVGAIVFSQLVGKSSGTLMALLLITLWGGVSAYYLYFKLQTVQTEANIPSLSLQKDYQERYNQTPQITNSPHYYIQKLHKTGIKYLVHSQPLVEIAYDIRWTRMFDKNRYQELIAIFDKLQKVYMYILGGRYYVESYLSTLNDLRQTALETLYSFYLIVPESFRHVYGLDPLKNIESNVDKLTKHTRIMLDIVEKYAKLSVKVPYIPETKPYPATTFISNNVLP
jgi:hypothetical protein